MAHRKTTSKKVASTASKILRSKNSSKSSKSVARSAYRKNMGIKKEIITFNRL